MSSNKTATFTSALMLGATMVVNNLDPLRELVHLVRNRKRFLVVLVCGAVGFVLLSLGILLGLLNFALLPNQEIVDSSFLSTAAIVSGAGGIVIMITSVLLSPPRAEIFSIEALLKSEGLNMLMNLLSAFEKKPDSFDSSMPGNEAMYRDERNASNASTTGVH